MARDPLLDDVRTQRATLADFGLFAFQCDDLDELLHRATELVSEAMDVGLVKVLEHRSERRDMLIRAGVNWQPDVVGHVTFSDHAHSPGGYALLSGEPVISANISEERRFEIPDVLIRHGVRSMVNVIIAGKDKPYGVLEVDAREYRSFTGDDVDFLRTYANLLAAAIDRMRWHRELQERAREQGLLARELGHRVKNTLGLVQALVSRTATAKRTAKEFQQAFLGRLQALAAAENLVLEDRDDAVDPRRIAEEVLEPHRSGRPGAVLIDGPSARLPARKGRMFGLALHELATNAAKYGALSVSEGSVSLEWHVKGPDNDRHLQLLWQERDGPEISPSERKGFGTRLLEDVVSHELNGTAELDYRPEGLTYTLCFPTE